MPEKNPIIHTVTQTHLNALSMSEIRTGEHMHLQGDDVYLDPHIKTVSSNPNTQIIESLQRHWRWKKSQIICEFAVWLFSY